MTAAQIAGLFGVWVIAVVSPGPDLVVVLQRSLTGRRHGVATAIGVVAGISVWIVAAFAGLATLVRVYPGLMTGLQVAGGVVLATLGALGLREWWRARSGRTPAPPDSGRAADARPPHGDLLLGLATNLSNPKALVFFGAVLTPFLTGELSVGLSLVLVAGMVAVALAWFCTLAVAASRRGVHARIVDWLPWVDLGASSLFVAVGVSFVIAALV